MAHALTAGRLLLYLQPSIPHLTRSARHRCLQRHGICRAAPHTHAPHRLHGRIQLHTQAKDPQRSHSLRLHLQNLDFRTRSIQLRSEPLNAGTEHLDTKHAAALARTLPMMYRVPRANAWLAKYRYAQGISVAATTRCMRITEVTVRDDPSSSYLRR